LPDARDPRPSGREPATDRGGPATGTVRRQRVLPRSLSADHSSPGHRPAGIALADPRKEVVAGGLRSAARLTVCAPAFGTAGMTPLQSLLASGTKVWLDSIDPDEIRRNATWGVTGATSNPIIVSDIVRTGHFDKELAQFIREGLG